MVNIRRNSNANNVLRRSHSSGAINSLFARMNNYIPLTITNIMKSGRYAMVGNNGALLGVALVHNNGPTRFLEIIGARKGYGKTLMNRIASNARNNGKNNVYLYALNPRLVQWYTNQGFRTAGPLQLGMTPMRRRLNA